MGQTGTKVANKLVNSFSFSGNPSEQEDLDGALVKFRGVAPLVYSRRGSMYFDEDGELAHEFYEEVMPKRGKGRRKMRRVCSKLLTPQGDVPYEPNPRLHTDCPVILYQG